MFARIVLFCSLSLIANRVFAENSCDEFLNVSKNPAQIYLSEVFEPSEILDLSTIFNVKQTLANLDKVLEAEPNNLSALKAYWHVSRNIRANLELQKAQLYIINRIINIEGKTERNQHWLLIALMQSKQFKEAFEIASSLVVEYFSTLNYRVLKVEALMGQNLFFDARDLATEYSAIYPEEVRFLELAAKSNLALAERSKSSFHFKAAEDVLVRLTLQADPKPWYFYSLLDAKLGQQKYQEVLDYVEFSGYQVLEGDGGQITRYHAYMGLKDFESASKIINKLLLEHPDSKRLAELRRRLTRAIKSDARGY